jgi:hypothetical protein
VEGHNSKISPGNRLTLIHGGLKMAWYDGVIVRWSGLSARILRWPISSVPTTLAELAPYFQPLACPTPPRQHEQKKSWLVALEPRSVPSLCSEHSQSKNSVGPVTTYSSLYLTSLRCLPKIQHHLGRRSAWPLVHSRSRLLESQWH